MTKAGNDCRKKKTTEEDQDEEVTVSVAAAAKDISVDSAVVAVLSNGTFTFKGGTKNATEGIKVFTSLLTGFGHGGASVCQLVKLMRHLYFVLECPPVHIFVLKRS